MNKSRRTGFQSALNERLLLLDGGMGTMLQRQGTFHGPAELLNVDAPERVASIHRAYLEAGADVITTNTFSANPVALADYGCSERAEELAYVGARLARNVVDTFSRDGKQRFRSAWLIMVIPSPFDRTKKECFYPEEVSALIIRQLLKEFRVRFSTRPIGKVVVTIPVDFMIYLHFFYRNILPFFDIKVN